MKQLFKSINPKQIFTFKNHKKTPNSSPTITKSEPPSFGSSYSSGSGSDSSGPTGPARTWSDPSLRPDPWTQQTFKMMDLDGDGKITKLELHSIFKRVRVNAPSLTDEEVNELIRAVDKDGDGCVSLEELEAVGSELDPTAADEDELKGAFGFFDCDEDGKITAEELHVGLVSLGDEKCTLDDCRRMIEGVDNNNDGFVCFDDFRRMMMMNFNR